ncbi:MULTISPECIES: PRC-barrel domain-containing protein [unclassified Ensifer]|uniref:PRC-barrel domain-containing protein n=1 Tax=unclassified Ensifer TaxID=2633371 RepID=UPI0008133C04|nr:MULTISPECIES: PRC-barrel domain-containing protein [unclassified Ensifer]OCP00314.1 photosystem reaction center subunit H [Ensifer sp. LC14]OCP07380.1 photosystem reaction center subunit H [Ensifer sp. LC11]OCP08123.1 photosystem reaction center subunit H [Ensifer sp. LC13]OCP31959.1 photosystem reaction center subunit H [Ensifer sp. LC499]
MTKKLATTVAAGALLVGLAVAPVSFAQDATKPMDQPQTMQPVPGSEAPADQAQTKPPISEEAPGAVATSDATYLTEQASDQIAASTYMGQTVYNAGDESIGEINDLIIKKDGAVEAAVIGVGGFLGIGEKNVAVPFDRITIAEQPNTDDLKLTTTETADTLKAAPEFKTKAQQVAEQIANQPVDTSTTSSTTTTVPAQPMQQGTEQPQQ